MNPLKEFSKWFIRVAVVVWIIGVIYGALIISAQLYIAATREYSSVSVDLTGYLMYIATPLTGGILGYMGKAAFENREKILQSFKFKKGGE
ncbi:MAG: hypothetical protein ACYCWE_09560 [Eubacteriales bacterium]